jgi:hypothetical protein
VSIIGFMDLLSWLRGGARWIERFGGVTPPSCERGLRMPGFTTSVWLAVPGHHRIITFED